MATVRVDQSNFDAEVLRSKTPVVVDFWAEWCGPCKMIGPSLEELSEEFVGRVKVAKLNVDESPKLAAKYGVRSIPMLAVFKSGEVADVKIGALPKSELATWFEQSI